MPGYKRRVRLIMPSRTRSPFGRTSATRTVMVAVNSPVRAVLPLPWKLVSLAVAASDVASLGPAPGGYERLDLLRPVSVAGGAVRLARPARVKPSWRFCSHTLSW